ncbi:2-C-methyl-D-erythritol 4-phosphate cytidylyltransferase [Petrotoga sp. 9PWA.NaAc.5.4]|uniref:2-C-methyl-D-erythritol 4-phosphate cytidylyltransferase n=1 Tax=Petrotoga sp. 9PWA.NaAc.5.4 TaxID=1434328 RepID=UPI000CC13A02|nr:2-C-methyl-D-erythritol 4-phosphate cytidylyltransferase [Petrotoga sp. 9PWA.NaAc.5.4]PNR94453.1 2-C-methyl-D-erythritol 4-phosphate cytidylyltransferase [Petrotoga sp. 9PWA.NaAc.5.4]
MVYAIIVAAGEGKRAGYEIPKQFQKLNNKTVLQLTAEKLQNSNEIDKFIVVTHKDYLQESKMEVSHLNKCSTILIGDKSRQESVFVGLNYLNNLPIKPNFVAIHDAVRPFTDKKKIQEVVDKAKNLGGAILAEKAQYTMSIAKESKLFKMLDRNNIYLHHTPQVFDFEKLFYAYKEVENKLEYFTDDASIYVSAGFEVYIVEDYKTNIKLTTKNDFEIAQCLIKSVY